MGIRTRLVATAVAAVTLPVLAGAATVSAAPSSPSASAPSSDEKDKKEGAGKGVDKDAVFAKVAAGLGVSPQQLVTALDHLKQAVGSGTSEAQAKAAFARELKVSLARAEQALRELSSDSKPKPGKDKDKDKQPGVPGEALSLLAAELHISTQAAQRVFDELDKVHGKGEDVVKDPAFVAIAAGIGVTPQRLLAALVKVKQQVAGKAKEKEKEHVPGGSPTK
jgi:hypothetical protein